MYVIFLHGIPCGIYRMVVLFRKIVCPFAVSVLLELEKLELASRVGASDWIYDDLV